MTEAEVSLRVAFHLLLCGLAKSDVQVALDGAQVQTKDTIHFPLAAFLEEHHCTPVVPGAPWQGAYSLRGATFRLNIHSRPGRGDVVARLGSDRTLRVESKKGPLARGKSSQEYPLLREAIGTLMTFEEASPDDLLAVAVPDTPKFRELVNRWRRAPLVARLGIQLITVHRDGSVVGLDAHAG